MEAKTINTALCLHEGSYVSIRAVEDGYEAVFVIDLIDRATARSGTTISALMELNQMIRDIGLV